MRAELSVVIPTLNAQAALPACLAALFEGVQRGLIRELIVTDGGSTDATAEIAEDVGARLVTGPASRGGQLARGCAEAKGRWILVLHADTHLSEGWSNTAADAMATGESVAFYAKLAFDHPGRPARLVAGWANLRSRLFGLPYGDQGLLIAASLYAQIGGYPDQPLMEDVAIARALKGRLRALPITARTSAARYVRSGWIRRGIRNLWTLTRYLSGTDPQRLAQDYRR